MSKKEFLALLRLKLSNIHAVEQEMFISFYDEIIQDMMENGMTEEEAVAKQGDISEIANNILADIGGNKDTKRKAKQFKKVALAILMIVLVITCMNVIKASRNMAKRRAEINVRVKDDRSDVEVNTDNGMNNVQTFSYSIIEDGVIDDEKAKVNAKEIIKLFSEGNYKFISDKYATSTMKKYFTEEVMEEAKKQVADDFGKLISYGQPYTCIVEQDGVQYIRCDCTCSYENVSVTYTIVFNEKYRLDGFFIK